MSAALLILRKDLLVLRRSPVLLGVLIAYPLVIALLIGLTAAYANAKPRVALVDRDHLPAKVTVAGETFYVDALIDEVAKNVELVRMRRGRGGPPARLRPGRGGGDDPARVHRHAEGARPEPAPDARDRHRRDHAARPPADAGARLQPEPAAAEGVHPGRHRATSTCSCTAARARCSAATSRSSGSTARSGCSSSCRASPRARRRSRTSSTTRGSRSRSPTTRSARPRRRSCSTRRPAAGGRRRSRRRCRPTGSRSRSRSSASCSRPARLPPSATRTRSAGSSAG